MQHSGPGCAGEGPTCGLGGADTGEATAAEQLPGEGTGNLAFDLSLCFYDLGTGLTMGLVGVLGGDGAAIRK